MFVAVPRQTKCGRRLACLVLFALAALTAISGAGHAQSPAIPPQGQAPAVPQAQVFFAPAESLTETVARLGGDPRPKSAEGAYQFLDWLLYTGMVVGAAYS
jgi:hypothetical protein